jgi:proline iminopeptidase
MFWYAQFAGLCILCSCATPKQLPKPPDEKTVVVPTSDGVALHATVLGRRSPTIIVLHGGPGATHDYLRPEWDALTSVGRVVYYDQRGCGRSTRRGPYSWQLHVSDLDKIITQLSPERRVVLAGSSWGSQLALLYAWKHPDRVSALILTGLSVSWLGRGLHPLGPDTILAGFVSGGTRDSTPVDMRNPIRVPLPSSPPAGGQPRFFEACLGAAPPRQNHETAPLLNELKSVSARVLLVAGGSAEEQTRDASKDIARVLPHAERVVIESTGHDPWFQRPHVFFDIVTKFIRGL